MKKIFSVILLSLFVAAAFAQTDETSRKRYALVIGNQNYKYAPLSSNIADATLVKDALEEKLFDVTFKKDLNTQELKTEVNNFIAKVNGDTHSVALVYLTGHAFTKDDKNYFLPVDNDSIISEEAAIEAGIDIEADLAGKINTLGQIYVIDGSYEDPYSEKGKRGLVVKGGLAAAKSARESTVGFIFSTSPDTVVSKANSSVFAKVFADEISSSKANLDEVFADVKEKVAAKTNNEQQPYSSATTLQFAFNGDELTALKKAEAIASADRTSIESLEMSRQFKEEQELRNAKLETAAEDASVAYSQVSAEIAEKRRLQQQEDDERLAQEIERAQNRSQSATAQIELLRQDFEESAELLKNSMKKNASAEERVDTIENMKSNLYTIRQTASEQITEYNQEKDAYTKSEVQKIWDREWRTVEKSKGQPSEEAIKRRQNEETKVREAGESDKTAYALSKNNEVAQDESVWLPKISSAYSKLEGDTYMVTSLDEALTVRVDDYDGNTAKWRLHVTADLFGHADVFEDDIYLGYAAVTGKKIKPLSELTDSEMDTYNQDVEVYDALFRSATPVFYVTLYYKIMRWDEASEYHFIPTKCEIIRLGKKNKVITKIAQKELDTCNFTQTPAVEIRSYNEIYADKQRDEKVVISEQKAKGTYVDPKLKSQAVIMQDNEKDLKGRNSLFVSGSYVKTNLFENESLNSTYGSYESPVTYNIQGNLTLSLGDFMYLGLGGGLVKWNYKELYSDEETAKNYDACTMMDANVFYGKLYPGLTFAIGNHFRVFGEGGIAYYAAPCNFIDYNYNNALSVPDEDEIFGLYAGGGFDIVLGKAFMITCGAGYNWMYYIQSFKQGIVDAQGISGIFDVLGKPDFNGLEFNVGVGLTW